MCLAVPAEVLSIGEDELRTARIAFGGAIREVSLALVPEAAVGDYVLVHAGFGIARVSEAHAREVLALLREGTP